MSKFNSKVLARILVAAGMASVTGLAMAGTTSGNLAMTAVLTSGCEVAAGAAIDFGSIVALASSGDKTADSGSTFKVACSSDVSPTIASTTTRSMTDHAGTPHLLPFNLSLTSGAASNDLATTTPAALTLVQDGTLKTITIYGKVLATDFSALPAGSYDNTMIVDVAY